MVSSSGTGWFIAYRDEATSRLDLSVFGVGYDSKDFNGRKQLLLLYAVEDQLFGVE